MTLIKFNKIKLKKILVLIKMKPFLKEIIIKITSINILIFR